MRTTNLRLSIQLDITINILQQRGNYAREVSKIDKTLNAEQCDKMVEAKIIILLHPGFAG